MKWIFVFLLVINLAILIWGVQYEPVDRVAGIAQQGAVGSMRLLSEVEEADRESAVVEEESDIVVEQQQSTVDEGEPLFERPVVTPRPKPVVKLVSRCGVLGVIDDRQVAQEARQLLVDEGAESSLQETNGKIEIGFWVVIPPLDSVDAAREMIDRLAEAGINDVWHFRSGELNNAISLGMFFQQENAEKLRLQIEQQGFKAELRSRFLNKRRYSIHFKLSAEADMVEQTWRRLKRSYPEIDLSERSCEEIATGG